MKMENCSTLQEESTGVKMESSSTLQEALSHLDSDFVIDDSVFEQYATPFLMDPSTIPDWIGNGVHHIGGIKVEEISESDEEDGNIIEELVWPPVGVNGGIKVERNADSEDIRKEEASPIARIKEEVEEEIKDEFPCPLYPQSLQHGAALGLHPTFHDVPWFQGNDQILTDFPNTLHPMEIINACFDVECDVDLNYYNRSPFSDTGQETPSGLTPTDNPIENNLQHIPKPVELKVQDDKTVVETNSDKDRRRSLRTNPLASSYSEEAAPLLRESIQENRKVLREHVDKNNYNSSSFSVTDQVTSSRITLLECPMGANDLQHLPKPVEVEAKDDKIVTAVVETNPTMKRRRSLRGNPPSSTYSEKAARLLRRSIRERRKVLREHVDLNCYNSSPFSVTDQETTSGLTPIYDSMVANDLQPLPKPVEFKAENDKLVTTVIETNPIKKRRKSLRRNPLESTYSEKAAPLLGKSIRERRKILKGHVDLNYYNSSSFSVTGQETSSRLTLVDDTMVANDLQHLPKPVEFEAEDGKLVTTVVETNPIMKKRRSLRGNPASNTYSEEAAPLLGVSIRKRRKVLRKHVDLNCSNNSSFSVTGQETASGLTLVDDPMVANHLQHLPKPVEVKVDDKLVTTVVETNPIMKRRKSSMRGKIARMHSKKSRRNNARMHSKKSRRHIGRKHSKKSKRPKNIKEDKNSNEQENNRQGLQEVREVELPLVNDEETLDDQVLLICARSWCNVCAPPKEMYEHILEKHGRAIRCSHCDFNARTISLLKKHTMTMHPQEPSELCSYCDFAGVEHNELEAHLRQNHPEEVEFPCGFCQFRSESAKLLRKHVVSEHSFATLMACNICRYTAVKTSCLFKHILTKHKDSTKFLCILCNYTQSTYYQFKTHVKKYHPSQI